MWRICECKFDISWSDDLHVYTYSRISHIDPVRESASQHKGQDMQRNQVDQENITSPWGNLQQQQQIISKYNDTGKVRGIKYKYTQ